MIKFISLFLGAFSSLLYVLLNVLIGPWDPTIDLIGSGILMFFLGIPHGAGDHLISEKLASQRGEKFHSVKFVILYLGIMAIYAVLWLLFPLFSFIVFIGISIFHFGDLEDITKSEDSSSLKRYVQLVLLGVGILGIILSSHWPEVVQIVENMGVPILNQIPKEILPISFLCFILGFNRANYASFLNTFLTLYLGTLLPLIPSFILFFTLCHSINSLFLMKNRLGITLLELYKKLLPFSLGAFFLGVIYIFLIYKDLHLYPLFIFLSLLTLPHFAIMHKLIFLKKINNRYFF